LRGVLPGILASPAYADRGLVVVTTDHAPDGGPVGALLLSRYVKPGAEVAVRYDAIALLRAVQDAFGLRHLGLSGRADRPRFGRAVWSRWSRNVHGTDTG